MAGSTGYVPVIGLEVHAQLLTRTKMFCRCPAAYGEEPNTMVCPVCLGLPGALPSVNREAVSMAVRLGLALGCEIERESVFARKNYFYPDAPRNYQITMYDRPLCTGGSLVFEDEGTEVNVGLEQIHLEDDAGKLLHGRGGHSLIDFNRCGVPLVEIVTRPEIHSPRQASLVLRRFRQLLRYLEICDGNLEEGSMRVDVNISVMRTGDDVLGTRTEIKNLNSFKAVEAGLEIEIERQRDELEAGKTIVQVTNLWDARERKLVTMRRKEGAHDYKYFPEPDLPVLTVGEGWIEEERAKIPELPLDRERRFRHEYGLPSYDAGVLTAESDIADYYEETARLTGEPKTSANWVMRDVMRELKSTDGDIGGFPAGPAALAGLIDLVKGGVVSTSAGVEIFTAMLESGESAAAAVKRLGLERISEEDELETIVDRVLESNPDELERYHSGKKQLMQFFVGQVMKESGGKADPVIVSTILRRKLGE
jgi:aspartyl-tRNA(Asn)/glutamyl-tRNA(Gln) amidotransferase subunit B